MNWSRFTDWLPLRPRHVLPVFGLASLLLFGPTELLATLDLEEFATRYQFWIGMSWAISGALLLPHALLPIFVAACFLLFAPADSLASLGLKKPTGDALLWVGLACVLSGSLIVARVVTAFAEPLQDWFKTQKERRKRIEKPPEKEEEEVWEANPEEAPQIRSLRGKNPGVGG